MKTQPRKILVTGAAGFIGARFIESCRQTAQGIPANQAARGEPGTSALSELSVISVDHPRPFGLEGYATPGLAEGAADAARSEHQAVDFGTRVPAADLEAWLAREQPALDSIIHLGAISTTTEFNWAKFQRWNIDYSKMLWSYAVKHQVPFIYASSAATYGEGEAGYDDDETTMAALKPLNPYGRSKLEFDLWALDQDRQGLAPPAWSGFKFFNVYGYGERHKGKQASVVLHSYDQIRRTGRATLFKSHREAIADGEQRRDFVFIDDVIRVLQFARQQPIHRGIYNLGTGQARSFLDLARATFAALGKPADIGFVPTPEAIRDKYQYFTEARTARLRAAGYSAPFTSLEDGIRQYVARLRTHETA